jgi:uncharacterized membrane protein YcjF (UPF0283 family)
MKTLRIILIIFAIVIIIGQMIVIDFKNPDWSENAGSYLSILAMILLIISMALSFKDIRQQ